MNWRNGFPCGTLITGLVGLLGGIFSFNFIQKIVTYQLKQQLPLINGTSTFDKWSAMDVPVMMKAHIFHVLNHKEVINGEKPKVLERGPYVFKEIIKREVLGWNLNESLISYVTRRYFEFDRSLSVGDLDDHVTVLNMPFALLSSMVMSAFSNSFFGAAVARILETAVGGFENVAFVSKSVKELLFDGYELHFVSPIVSHFKIKVPQAFAGGKFGILRGQNGSDDGLWTVRTGKHNIFELGSVHTWNNLSEFKCWNGKRCNQIWGTDGTIHPPLLSTTSKLQMFAPQINRSAYMTFEAVSTTKGINTFKFTQPKELFESEKSVPENGCFCTKYQISDGEKLNSIDGVLDLSSCNDRAPIVVSAPHFYDGSSILKTEIEGLKPVKELHETYAEVDPLTGATIEAARRLQINVHIRNLQQLSSFRNIKSYVFPIAWFEEKASMPDEMSEYLRLYIHGGIWLADALAYSVLFVSLAAIIYSIKGYYVRYQKRSSITEDLNHNVKIYWFASS